MEKIYNLLEEIEDIRLKIDAKRGEFSSCSVDDRALHSGVQKLPYAKMHCIAALKAHTARVYEAFWSPNDEFIISVGSDNCIVIWDTSTGYIHNLVDATLHQPVSADVTKDMNFLFCGGLCARVIVYKLFDPKESKKHRMDEDRYPYEEYDVVNTLEHESKILQVCLMGTSVVAAVSESEGLNVWDYDSTKRIRSLAPTVGQSTCMTYLHKKADNTNLYLTGSTYGTITLWDLRTKEGEALFYEAHESDVTCLRSVPNTLTFLSGSDDTFCQLYDIRMDIPVARYSEPVGRSNDAKADTLENTASRPELASVNTIAVSPSGRMFFAGCNDNFMYIWDILSTSESLLQREEGGVVKCLNFSSRGCGLVNVVWDQRNRIRVFTP